MNKRDVIAIMSAIIFAPSYRDEGDPTSDSFEPPDADVCTHYAGQLYDSAKGGL